VVELHPIKHIIVKRVEKIIGFT